MAEADKWFDICHKPLKPEIEDAGLTSAAATSLPPEPWDENTYGEWMNTVKAETGKKGKDLFHPLRLALTGLPDGPELKHLLPFIGREKAQKRLMGISD